MTCSYQHRFGARVWFVIPFCLHCRRLADYKVLHVAVQVQSVLNRFRHVLPIRFDTDPLHSEKKYEIGSTQRATAL